MLALASTTLTNIALTVAAALAPVLIAILTAVANKFLKRLGMDEDLAAKEALHNAISNGVIATVMAAKNAQPLSVNQIYRRANRGVVEITVTTSGENSPFGGGGGSAQAQGSGWVYDTDGHIVTTDHVVNGAQSISVRFWNGKSYSDMTGPERHKLWRDNPELFRAMSDAFDAELAG